MPTKVLTEEQETFLRVNACGQHTETLARLLNEQFGTSFTRSQIKSYKSNHKIHSGRNVPNLGRRLLTREQDAMLRELAPLMSAQDVADKLNATFGLNLTKQQIKGYKNVNKVRGRGMAATHWRNGVPPINKGKKWHEFMSSDGMKASRRTQFKKGQIPHNGGTPIGTERLRQRQGARAGEKCVWVKIAEPNKWREKHRLVWEAAHGPISKGHVIRHIDNDATNNELSNLFLLSLAEHVVLNNPGAKLCLTGNADADRAVLLLIKLKASTEQRKRQIRKRRGESG